MSTTIDEIEIETALAIPPAKPATDHNGNPVRYTGPGYTWEPGRKTSSGSFLRIQRDGTVTYSNPNCLKYAAPGSKPFKMPALKPRIETPGATGFSKAFERIKDSIQKRMLKNARANFGRYNGTPCLDGWEIVSTDGKTALLKPGAGVGTRTPILDIWAGAARKVGLLDNPEFHLALKRAALMVDERAPRVRLIGNPGELRITSEHGEPVRQTAGNDAGDFEETLPVTSWEPWHVAINPEFLEPMCGAWPLTVWYAGDTNAIVFEADDLSFRYVVMPLGDKWDGVDLSRTWDGVTPGRADAALEPEAEPEPVPLNLADFFPEPEPEAVESDLCPICGDTVTLKETRTKDGRLIGSCGDAFTSAQWNSGRDAIVSKEPATIAATEPEPVPVPPPAKPEPLGPSGPGVPEPRCTRMLIGETVSETQARDVVRAMLEHIRGLAGAIVRGEALTEMGGYMVVMMLEFETAADALRYHAGRHYRQFVEKTRHLLLGDYVVKLFRKHTDGTEGGAL